LKRFTAFFAPIFKNLWQTTPPDCCREQTGKTKKFPLRYRNRYIGGASQYIRKPEPPRKAVVF